MKKGETVVYVRTRKTLLIYKDFHLENNKKLKLNISCDLILNFSFAKILHYLRMKVKTNYSFYTFYTFISFFPFWQTKIEFLLLA